mmetsp:Transcript_37966/g.127034  ORF Transcript_37966/g.127034 Transcript_37966/m.127034 type:complete len:319 (+) Transcript_37966:133-1089(+)
MSAPNFCFAHAAGASDQERGYQPNQWPCHPDDEQRIAALHDFHLLDTDFEEPFDRLATLAARHFDVPIALVSLVDTDRQWFKAAEGLPVRQTCRDAAFCTHAIMPGAPTIFEINDAAEDKRFCDNPLVTGDPYIRYYAGRALVCDGQPIGTLCLIDRKPRPPLDDSQRKELIMFADMVVDLVYRRQLGKQYEFVQSQLYKKTDELQAKNRELSDLVDTANAPIFAVDRRLVVTAWNQKVSQLTSIPAQPPPSAARTPASEFAPARAPPHGSPSRPTSSRAPPSAASPAARPPNTSTRSRPRSVRCRGPSTGSVSSASR